MRPVARFALASLSLLLGCARPPATSMQLPPRPIAVFPPNNRTGDDLLVAGASFLEKYALKSDRVTVPDVLASEARLQLARRGYTVVPPETVDAAVGEHPPKNSDDAAAIAARRQIDGNVLYIEVRRWEPDVPFKPTFVIVSVELALIDPSTGKVVWHIDHPSRPVPTNGVISVGDAYTVAARKLMEELLTSLGPEQAPQ
ncbi:MAG TPA: hypothetical protein VL403_10500 [Candidatus Kryptonia bacterium]|nr:hypothetical protein [Candidatus Kryptonia bacterium]